MKRAPHSPALSTPGFSRPPARTKREAGGFALVIVLSILVLVVAIVLTFLVRAGTERTSSASYNASVSARQMADTAVSLVQAQINQAATQGSSVAWMSQPGMVRTYDQSGLLLKAYKLYSAPDMISGATGIANGKSPDEPPADWGANPTIWTDLNAPMELSNGEKIFPILDPKSSAEGYAISFSGTTAYQQAPMPVRWLYVLQDGSMVAPTGGGKTATIPGETATNKIIGRIAFWTDDDTCKVNINTASAGTFWDVPRAYSSPANALPGPRNPAQPIKEQELGYYQPIQHEFQRYPGHPAMTDLRAVFSGSDSLTADQIYSIVPRVIGGGSAQGTVHIAGSTAALAADADRLYASVDELIFNPDRAPNAGLAKAQVEHAKFFLTAHSRAPETNLFNLPRIACWPIHADLATAPDSIYATTFDRLIAFCASTGSGASLEPYYFQRQNALSATNDISLTRNQQLYAYLQYLTGQPIPGFGGNFSAKYAADRDQILTEIFDYIRSANLYDNTLAPGRQFTEASRGCVVPSVSGTTMGLGRYFTLSELAIGFICNADGNDPKTNNPQPPPAVPLGRLSSNVPEADVTNPGFSGSNRGGNRVLGGKALEPGEKYVQAIIVPEFFSVMYGFISMMPNMKVSVSGLDKLTLNDQPLFPTEANATISYHDVYPDGSSLAGGQNGLANFSTGVASKYGGNPGWRYFALCQRSTTKGGSSRYVPARGNIPGEPNTVDEPYPFVGTPVKITDAGTMDFGGAVLTVTISGPDNIVVQTLQINLPSTTLPVPKLVTEGTVSAGNGGIAATNPESWWGFNKLGIISDGYIPPKGAYSGTSFGRLNGISRPPNDRGNPPTSYGGAFFRENFDVVRSVLPPHGDFRIVAGRHDVPVTVFQPHDNYKDPSVMMATSLSNMVNTRYDWGLFDTHGTYNTSIIFPGGHEPDISASLDPAGMPQATGDYDDPLPDVFPGPFANKPNEGSTTIPTLPKSIPYYSSVTQTTANGADITDQPDGGTFYSPNRIMTSPGMFGSLPTGVLAGKPWQTLLFRPQSGHFGASDPPDHLWLDLFWMPVVEPYAISDRFSTDGKINLNYQILPFTYLTRSTGLRALFKDEKVTAMPNTEVSAYKAVGAGTTAKLRNDIDADQTLAQFQAKFTQGDVFKSASEICSVHIVPVGQTAAGMPAYWQNNALTGDNVRELIYTNLYPRLTTKSNTYTVHFYAQSLKKVPGSATGTWTEGRDVVTGEYRGSTSIERFIDANSDVPNYAATPSQIPNMKTLDTLYRWRVIANRQFTP